MIYYENFSAVEVFEDPRLNVFFNQLFTGLINAFSEERVKENLLIDGRVSLVMQEIENIPSSFSKIELSTADKDIFKFLQVSAKIFNIKSLSSTDELIIIKTATDHNIYFNLKHKEMESVNLKEIHLRKSTEIL